jgi:hypothetical protein
MIGGRVRSSDRVPRPASGASNSRHRRLLRNLTSPGVLILHDWELAPAPACAPRCAGDFGNRYDRRSIIVTSQVPGFRWTSSTSSSGFALCAWPGPPHPQCVASISQVRVVTGSLAVPATADREVGGAEPIKPSAQRPAGSREVLANLVEMLRDPQLVAY